MGKFHLVYYISMGTPSIEASLQMAETYLAHGVSAIPTVKRSSSASV